MRSNRFIWALAALVLLVAGVLHAAPPAFAHGNIDQTLEGDPGCNTTNFAASVTAASGQRQSFVPSGSLLASVALCATAAAPNTPLVVAIYDSGGGLIGGGSTANNPSIPDSAGPAVRWVHVDFLQPYAVTPGATYIIENQSGVAITWYGTDGSSPYTYCGGEPNTSTVVDFGFQSFLADTGTGTVPCPEPTVTSTPVPPPPTNTPAPQPTNTLAPGETPAPTNTPLSAGDAATQDAGDTATTPGGGGESPDGTAAGAGSAPTGRALPDSGAGPGGRNTHSTEAVLLTMLGAALVVWGCARRRRWGERD